MSCNPLDKCCEITPSTCVLVTIDLDAHTYLRPAGSGLNDYLKEFEFQINYLNQASHISTRELTDYDTCNLIDRTNIIYRDRNTNFPDYAFVSEVLKQSLTNICTIKSSVDYIYHGGKLTDEFLNLELPDKFKDLVSCLNCDDGCDAKIPTTLGNLLEILVGKIIAYENANSKLNCDKCN
jgi:hypothetical protein